MSRPYSNKSISPNTILKCYVLGNGQVRCQSTSFETQHEISKSSDYPSYIVEDKTKPECHNKVVFVRHGQSIWNKASRFSGWVDVPLNEIGEREAIQAGQLLKELGFHFDVSYTSYLCRATRTNELVLGEMGLLDSCKVIQSWRLNERHYGQLQGLCKIETAKKYGNEQLKLWR